MSNLELMAIPEALLRSHWSTSRTIPSLFAVDHPDYVLIIKDEDGIVVYSTIVYPTQTEVILPSTLSGDYEVNLVMGNWLFIGEINL